MLSGRAGWLVPGNGPARVAACEGIIYSEVIDSGSRDRENAAIECWISVDASLWWGVFTLPHVNMRFYSSFQMNPPDQVLREYMAEMNSWEMRCAQRLGECISGAMTFDAAKRVGMDEFTAISNRYCSPSAAVRRDYFFTEPPDYDPDGEIIETVNAVSPVEVEIFTRQEYGHKKRHVYSVIIDAVEWRLFRKRVLCDDGEMIDAIL